PDEGKHVAAMVRSAEIDDVLLAGKQGADAAPAAMIEGHQLQGVPSPFWSGLPAAPPDRPAVTKATSSLTRFSTSSISHRPSVRRRMRSYPSKKPATWSSAPMVKLYRHEACSRVRCGAARQIAATKRWKTTS